MSSRNDASDTRQATERERSASEVRPFWSLLPVFYRNISPQRRRQLFLLLVLMLVGAIAELATLGSLLPFLSLLAGNDLPSHLPLLGDFFIAVGAISPPQQVFVTAVLFGTIALTAGAVRVALNWSTQMFTAGLANDLSVEVQRRILLQPYPFHLERNSSQAIGAIDKVNSLVFQVILQLILAATAAFIAMFIVAALMLVDPLTATIAAVAFSVVYLLVSAFTRPQLARNSEAIRTAYEDRVKIIQESIGGIRDVIIDGSQSLYLTPFSRLSRKYSTASATTAFVAAAPRFIIEAVGMAVIAIVAFLIAQREGGLAGALPVLGAVALGAQRLLPLLQQVYHGWASAAGHSSLLPEVLALLKLPTSDDYDRASMLEPLPLVHQITFKGVSFAYPGRKRPVLDEVTLNIPRGSMVGVVGKTGIGKSTLADLLMGLIEPVQGQILIDDVPLTELARVRWRRNIAHVPQSIFLADASIAQNIAFGSAPTEIEDERLASAAQLAQLDDFISSLPDGYSTLIGERGVRLSGGQRQRLGIARAIYKRSPVVILDEATSALDDVTEASVMRNLRRLIGNGTTIIVIAHRMSTVGYCDFLLRLENADVAVVTHHPEIALTSNG